MDKSIDRRSKKRRYWDNWFKLFFGYCCVCKYKFKKNDFRYHHKSGGQICIKCNEINKKLN